MLLFLLELLDDFERDFFADAVAGAPGVAGVDGVPFFDEAGVAFFDDAFDLDDFAFDFVAGDAVADEDDDFFPLLLLLFGAFAAAAAFSRARRSSSLAFSAASTESTYESLAG